MHPIPARFFNLSFVILLFSGLPLLTIHASGRGLRCHTEASFTKCITAPDGFGAFSEGVASAGVIVGLFFLGAGFKSNLQIQRIEAELDAEERARERKRRQEEG